MIEEQGRVVDIDEQGVWVEVNRRSACASCSARAGCGQRVIAESTGAKAVVICIDKPEQMTLSKDDNVVMGIAEGAFLKASALLYFLPLLAMFLIAAVATALQASELIVVASALAGLAVGLFAVSRLARYSQRAKEYHPVILRIV